MKYVQEPSQPSPRVTVADYQRPPRDGKARHPLLIGLAVLLVLLLGAGGYFFTLDTRYAAKCRSAHDTLQDVQTLVRGVKGLPYDPASDEVQSYVAKLDDAGTKLGRLADDFAGTRVSKKNEERNKALVDAIRQERALLDDTGTLLKNGIGSDESVRTGKISADTEKKAKQFDADFKALKEKSQALDFDDVDFVGVMNLSPLDKDIINYLERHFDKRREELVADAQKAAKEAQQAATQRKADAGAKRQALHQEIKQWKQKSVDAAAAGGQATFVVTDMRYDDYENLMESEGYLYNYTNRTLRGKVTVTYTVSLYKDGEVVETDDRSYDLNLQQPLPPNQKAKGWILNSGGPNARNGYDDYYVECKSVQ